ncbi:hypothetical protein [Comamonas terrae]|uniref:Uncharacterized protein n=1 Tax=Comamonas terrae TaxID=673548 RepID=A0ABW5UPV6_9BURK|nr:hypothetical protein [Comamonas terrae]
MPSGFQVFHPNGAIKVDSSMRLSRVIETIYVGGSASGSYTNEQLLSGTPFAIFIPTQGVQSVRFSFSGATLNWSKYQTQYPTDGYLVIGVY